MERTMNMNQTGQEKSSIEYQSNISKSNVSSFSRIYKRPRRVTIIAWLMLILGSMSFFITVLATAISKEMRPAIPILVALSSGGTLAISGIAMLRGCNWGRYLYIYGILAINILWWFEYGFKPTDVLSIGFYAVFVYLLTTPIASAYFLGTEEPFNRLNRLHDKKLANEKESRECCWFCESFRLVTRFDPIRGFCLLHYRKTFADRVCDQYSKKSVSVT
jgi:hypothetical protein